MSLVMTVEMLKASAADYHRVWSVLQKIGDDPGSIARVAESAFQVFGAHDALTDEADWNARTWSMDPSKTPRLASFIRATYELSSFGITLEVLWAGERSKYEKTVEIDAIVARVLSSTLEATTKYFIQKPN